MNQNGRALHWTARVLGAEDVRRRLDGHRILLLAPGTVVTPLAAEELRAKGVQVDRETGAKERTGGSVGYAADRCYPPVLAGIGSTLRDGLNLRELCSGDTDSVCGWSRVLAGYVARGECSRALVFCEDPGLVSCVANKLAGLRAAMATTIGQAARATLTLGANLLAVEMPGRTYFEVRQILKMMCSAGGCPEDVAKTLLELDGHAHR